MGLAPFYILNLNKVQIGMFTMYMLERLLESLFSISLLCLDV